jgi:hypothetical protein
MSPPTNKWRQRRIEHRFNAEIVAQQGTQSVTTHNQESSLFQFEDLFPIHKRV